MGRKSKIKGKVYERKVASILRERFPELAEDIRRSIQSRGAEESDVAGLPHLWIECQDAQQPTPLSKLEQAEHDYGVCEGLEGLNCIAVTHKLLARTHQVTMRSYTYLKLVTGREEAAKSVNTKVLFSIVTVDLADFLDIYESYLHKVRLAEVMKSGTEVAADEKTDHERVI